MAMRIALVYRGRYLVRQALELETLAAVLSRAGHRVFLAHEPDTFGITDNVFQVPAVARHSSHPAFLASRILEIDPDVALVSALPATFRALVDTARLVRRGRPVPMAWMGLHPTLAPAAVAGCDVADCVIQGEVENVVLPLVDRLGSGASFQDLGSLWFAGDGGLVRTPRAPLVDLDALPLPDKDLFSPFARHDYSYATMVSRGCPFACSFCEETAAKNVHGPGYFRRKGVDTVMAELVAGKRRFGFREVIFKDSYLSGDKDWLARLMERYRREINVPFKCFCTIVGCDEDTARLLTRGGCYSIEFGLQTWNETLRRTVLNRRETNEQARQVFDICARHGLWYDVDHMFGLPGETVADHAQGARQYAALSRLNRIKVHHLVILPGAPIAEEAQKAGLLGPDAEARLEQGMETDFYDPVPGPEQDMVKGFATLYKLLPGLPRRLVHSLTRRPQLVRALGRVPPAGMAPLQGLMAARSRDRRFAAYALSYPGQVAAALGRVLGRFRKYPAPDLTTGERS